MKINQETRNRLKNVLGFAYCDEEYTEMEVLEIIDDLIIAIKEKEEAIKNIEEDRDENYRYIGGREYDYD